MNSMKLAWRVYEDVVDMYAERKFHEVVLPFCKARNWEFLAGNGAWRIGPPGARHTKPFNYSEDTEYQIRGTQYIVAITGRFCLLWRLRNLRMCVLLTRRMRLIRLCYLGIDGR